MEIVTLGSQGQLVLPKTILSLHQWVEGTKFFIWEIDDEIVLKPVSKFPVSQLESPYTPSVYQSTPLTLEQMEKAIDETIY